MSIWCGHHGGPQLAAAAVASWERLAGVFMGRIRHTMCRVESTDAHMVQVLPVALLEAVVVGRRYRPSFYVAAGLLAAGLMQLLSGGGTVGGKVLWHPAGKQRSRGIGKSSCSAALGHAADR